MELLVIGRLTNNLWPCLLLLTVICSPSWGQSDAISNWQQKISGQLKSYAQFPPEACGRSGEAKLAFALDRSGKVISSKVVSGSGVAAIDAAALAAVKSAQPFPPAPPEVLDNQLSLQIVLVFPKPEGIAIRRACEVLRDEMKVRERLKGVCRGC